MIVKTIISDVDGTLTESRQVIGNEVASLIAEILKKFIFCAISGGDEKLLQRQFEPLLKRDDFKEKNFFLSATSGTALFKFENKISRIIYKEYLTSKEKHRINIIIHALANEFWLKPVTKDSGPLIEDRVSQITLSCLGHQAPRELKEKWDPDGKRRVDMIKWIYSNKKKEILDTTGLSIFIGGATSIDFVKAGITKKFGIKKLLEYLKTPKEEAIFFGDKTQEGGNDYIENYVKTVQVNIPEMNNYLRRIVENELDLASL